MSQHSQRTQNGPEMGWILTGVAITTASAAGTIYIATGEVDGRGIAGCLLGILLTVLLLAQTLGLVAERQEARDRRVRQEARQRREAAERAASTGTWTGDRVGRVLTVRYEESTGSVYVQGFLGVEWSVYPERVWVDVVGLAQLIDELEVGRLLVPADDEVTSLVRWRLGLPDESGMGGWPVPVDGEAATAVEDRPETLAEMPPTGGVAPAVFTTGGMRPTTAVDEERRTGWNGDTMIRPYTG